MWRFSSKQKGERCWVWVLIVLQAEPGSEQGVQIVTIILEKFLCFPVLQSFEEYFFNKALQKWESNFCQRDRTWSIFCFSSLSLSLSRRFLADLLEPDFTLEEPDLGIKHYLYNRVFSNRKGKIRIWNWIPTVPANSKKMRSKKKYEYTALEPVESGNWSVIIFPDPGPRPNLALQSMQFYPWKWFNLSLIAYVFPTESFRSFI